MEMRVIRRLGGTTSECASGTEISCPNVLELNDGRLAIIGTDHTEDIEQSLPPGVARAPYERIVVIPREILTQAIPDILNG